MEVYNGESKPNSHLILVLLYTFFLQRSPPQLENILKMISETAQELATVDRIIYKYSSHEQCSYILITVEPNIYLVILFESKKSEKDTYISNFVIEICHNLRCTKVFTCLKNTNK